MELTYAERLARMNALVGPVAQQAIASLPNVERAHGLDAGCGIGRHVAWLAERFPDGHVTGLDSSPDNLRVAREHSASERTRWVEGDLTALAFDDDAFDFVWCADALWPGFVDDPVSALRGFRRVVRSGGWIALWYWMDQSLLPGYPQLEARLRSTLCDSLPYTANVPPEDQIASAASWFRRAGLTPLRSQAFMRTLAAPLDSHEREGVHDAIDMLYADAAKGLEDVDAELYRSITHRSSDTSIARASAYFGWIVYVLHLARV